MFSSLSCILAFAADGQVFISALLPFIGFGFLDNGLMILYGALRPDLDSAENCTERS